MSELRVGLDLRSGTGGWLGGLYYLRNLAGALSVLPENEAPHVIAIEAVDDPQSRGDEFRTVSEVRPMRGGDTTGSIRGRLTHRARQRLGVASSVPVGMRAAAQRYGIDVAFPTFEPRPITSAMLPWIPDVQHLRAPENFTRDEIAARSRWMESVIEGSPLVVVSSQSAFGDVSARFRGSDEKLRILRFTTVPEPTWLDGEPASVARQYGLPERYFLLPNQFWVHKDHRTAFEAVRILASRGPICLACTGGSVDHRQPGHYAQLVDLIQAYGLQSSIRLLGVVPRSDYIQLLRGAVAVVQPSRFEGWSSIVEDARALGKRIVLSDLDVHREQAPPSALFFPTGDVEALSATLTAIDDLHAPPEEVAMAAQYARARAYGRRFLEIAHDAVATHTAAG